MLPEYNLLTENWIPVKSLSGPERISLKDLLCSQDEWRLSLTRDDMELACLQMIICIVQVIFMPKNIQELTSAYETSMKKEVYDKKISAFKNWFDLLHPEYPFMQSKSIEQKKLLDPEQCKSLQKLLVGLPEKSTSLAWEICPDFVLLGRGKGETTTLPGEDKTHRT